MISLKEVRHIAALARLNITKKEEEKFKKDLSAILDYIEKLKKVDISETKETSHPISVNNVTRRDEFSKFGKKLIDDHLKVRSILR